MHIVLIKSGTYPGVLSEGFHCNGLPTDNYNFVTLYSPQELVAVRAVGWSTEEFLDEVMSLDRLDHSLATVDGSSPTSKGSGILW